jgi:Flp pilus assembly protein CpaB
MKKIRIAIVSGLIAAASVAGVVAHGATAAPQPAHHAAVGIDCCQSANISQN